MTELREIHPAVDWLTTRQWAIAKLVATLGEAQVEEKYLIQQESGPIETTYEVVSDRDAATHVLVVVRR